MAGNTVRSQFLLSAAQFIVVYVSIYLPSVFKRRRLTHNYSSRANARTSLHDRNYEATANQQFSEAATRTTISSLLSCFAAGVLLAILFLECLVDSEQNFSHFYSAVARMRQFPWGNFIVALGFLSELITDQCMVSILAANNPFGTAARPVPTRRLTPITGRIQSSSSPNYGSSDRLQPRSRFLLTSDADALHANQIHARRRAGKIETFRLMTLVVVFCFHSILSNFSDSQAFMKTSVFTFAVSLIVDGLIAFSIGLLICRTEHASGWSRHVYRFAFAVANPVGVVISFLLTNVRGSVAVLAVRAVLESFVGGVLLYIIVVIEIYSRQFCLRGEVAEYGDLRSEEQEIEEPLIAGEVNELPVDIGDRRNIPKLTAPILCVVSGFAVVSALIFIRKVLE